MPFPHKLQCTVTLNSNFAILKNLKLFSIRIKELFKPSVYIKKPTDFCSFEKHFLEKPIFE